MKCPQGQQRNRSGETKWFCMIDGRHLFSRDPCTLPGEGRTSVEIATYETNRLNAQFSVFGAF